MKPVDIAQSLYVGNDASYERVKDKSDWKTLRCCKYGVGGHQQSLGYSTLGAPKDSPDYLSVVKQNRMALNMIDVADPNLIPVEMVETGLKYVDSQLRSGHKVLIACNAGRSRDCAFRLARGTDDDCARREAPRICDCFGFRAAGEG